MGLTGIPPAAFMRGGDPTDPRSMRTRRQLLEAFEQALEAGTTPTVSDLVRDAGISRSTFYAHFTGIEEVGVAALRVILDAFEPSETPDVGDRGVGPSAATFEDLFAHLGAHRRLCSAVLVTDAHLPAFAELKTTLVSQLTAAINRSSDTPEGLDAGRAASFLVGGILALLLESLRSPEQSEDEDLGATLAAMLPEWLAGTRTLVAPISFTPALGNST
ncbi:TetR/AcrR family transcriptional regulator [Nocardia salmonicida]|uniref:TetR/AcrR family transcriptional regulator n=1 Tax=Nocardia salmonicida TaxID=53431 RepID=A0ABZ1N318_9NOCA